MFGQRADSHTVCRFKPRRSRFSWLSDSKCVRPLRAHSGRRGAGAVPDCRRSAPADRSRLYRSGCKPASSRSVLALPRPWRIRVRAHQYANQTFGAGAEHYGEPVVSQVRPQDLRLRLPPPSPASNSRRADHPPHHCIAGGCRGRGGRGCGRGRGSFRLDGLRTLRGCVVGCGLPSAAGTPGSAVAAVCGAGGSGWGRASAAVFGCCAEGGFSASALPVRGAFCPTM